jgi:hypothetical protein
MYIEVEQVKQKKFLDMKVLLRNILERINE